jgi:hypothetical protein
MAMARQQRYQNRNKQKLAFESLPAVPSSNSPSSASTSSALLPSSNVPLEGGEQSTTTTAQQSRLNRELRRLNPEPLAERRHRSTAALGNEGVSS